jgi:hypothetical protein
MSRELFPTATFGDRLKHFFAFTNPFLLTYSREAEREAFDQVAQYRATGAIPTGLSFDDIRKKALLADNAYAKDGSRSESTA